MPFAGAVYDEDSRLRASSSISAAP